MDYPNEDLDNAYYYEEDPDGGDYEDEEPPVQMHDLIRDNKLDVLQESLASSPELVRQFSWYGTPVAVAIQGDNIAAVRILLDAGASPLEDETRSNHCCYTTLERAAMHGNRDIFRLLLNRLKVVYPTGVSIADQYETELVWKCLNKATGYGHTGIVCDLLDAIEWSDHYIQRALSAASWCWEPDLVEMMLERFQFGTEVLIEALDGAMKFCPDVDETRTIKHYRVVSRLIAVGDIDVGLAKYGSHLLRQALEGVEMRGGLKALLENGADPNTQWEDGCTGLHLLAYPLLVRRFQGPHSLRIHEEGIRLLLDHGASITVRDDEGATPSHRAAEGCSTEIFLKYYRPTDSDLLSTNLHEETLLHYAAAGGKHETVNYLLSRGVFDVNASNINSWTPIICALAPNNRVRKGENGAVKSARALLRSGADPRAVTSEGWTLLHVVGSHEGCRGGSVSEVEEEHEEASDEEGVAATLAQELLTGPLDQLPIESPAQVCRLEPNHEDRRDLWEAPRETWGGRVRRMFLQAEEWPPSVTIISDRTPLHWAAEHGAPSVVRVFRELKGADKDAVDSEGDIPWNLANKSAWIRGNLIDETIKAVE